MIAVLAGGLVGSASRTAIGLWLSTDDGGFPTAVLVVNLLGAFVLGLYVARRERSVGYRHSLQFWAIGVLGSFTTFSTFSVDLVRLIDGGRPGIALGYLTASLIGGLALALAGLRIGAAAE